eukprot:gnl/TRDRNA2_/TRDRNA2_133713_c1_seq1.p1 gnl/TRDRNA2_/TRDRNA2_133713_c1~~gnl/TRDRNA2_/TRDRNA2_133713_c1_seq1.p1  ORF type:complete len:348 (-),score=61.55 gnl/TRDRNA2_/TRDRNA2_133713_c1_seq1:62-1105(-)
MEASPQPKMSRAKTEGSKARYSLPETRTSPPATRSKTAGRSEQLEVPKQRLSRSRSQSDALSPTRDPATTKPKQASASVSGPPSFATEQEVNSPQSAHARYTIAGSEQEENDDELASDEEEASAALPDRPKYVRSKTAGDMNSKTSSVPGMGLQSLKKHLRNKYMKDPNHIYTKEEDQTPPLPEHHARAPQVRLPYSIAAIQAELKLVHETLSPSMCRVELVDADLFSWEVAIVGPADTPYKDGIFWFLFSFPATYPNQPIHIRCQTPIYHCNIDSTGTVCLGTLDTDSSEKGRISTAIDTIKGLLSLLSLPMLENALVPEAADLFLTDRREHDRIALDATLTYALS